MKMGSMSCTSVMVIARLANVDSGLFLSWSLKNTRVGRGREKISIRNTELFNSIKSLTVVVGSKFLPSPGNHLFFKLPAGIIVHSAICISFQR